MANEIWNDIPNATFQKMIYSMPKRIAEVINVKGGHIKY